MSSRATLRLSIVSVALSLGLIVALSLAYAVYDSKLALAQAADSASDIFASGVLWGAIRCLHGNATS